MRCLALAQAWQAEGRSVYLIGKVTRVLRKRLSSEGVDVRPLESTPGGESDTKETIKRARELSCSWIVVDGYHFDSSYQRQLREEGWPVLLLDDHGHEDHYEADLVLNQNIGAETSLYPNSGRHTDLLLGPEYALLRKEFWPWESPRRPPRQEATRVLVTLGGADPKNLTSSIARALGELNTANIHVTVVMGGSNTHREEVRAAVEEAGSSVKVQWNVKNMASLMARNDIAVSAGGSTCLELAFMGVPHAVVAVTENQKATTEQLDEDGVAISLGWHETLDASNVKEAVKELLQQDERRVSMARRAQKMVDARGSARVLEHMRLRSKRRRKNTANARLYPTINN
jgi:UDP-2,4-diacetamido-2,4,6-trideoxy-beta-L-altropyranose hydrolase